MLNEPFESDQPKRWPQLSEFVKDVYRKVNEITIKPLFDFKIIDLFDTNGEQIGYRIYCLGSITNDANESSLLYCDINNDNLQLNSNQLNINQENTNQSIDDEDNQNLPTFRWKELIEIDLANKSEELYQKLSIEEKLQLERKRLLVGGISSYEFNEKQRRFVFSLDSVLHYFDDNDQPPYKPIQLPSLKKTSKINPSICPFNADLIAYVSDNDLFVLNIRTGFELQLTNNKQDEPKKDLTSGVPSFIIQEEFERLIGFWWQKTNKFNKDEYKIIFEQVDETDVELIKIASFDGNCEDYKYPKPGKNNAISIIKMASFKVDTNSNQFHDVSVDFINNITNFKQLYPDFEYLIDCHWCSEDSIVVQLLNRKQTNLVAIIISIAGLFEPQIIYEEINNTWINTGLVLEFLKDDEDDDCIKVNKVIKFIRTSQESGFRHLYKISVQIKGSSNPQNQLTNDLLRSTQLNKIQLTSGNWETSSRSVWIDSKNKLIYFIGLKDSPLEKQLYVISLNDEQKFIKKLTTSGYSNTLVSFNSQFNLFLNIQSSISKPPFGSLSVINQNLNSQQLPSIYRIGYFFSNKIVQPDGSVCDFIEKFESLAGFSRPELFSYQLKDSGDIVYGLIFKPDFMEADKKYPVLLEVYGGPGCQLIINNFKSVRSIERHILASQGYVVVIVDGRGTCNRGTAFENHLYRRLGQVEVQDQVEVLQYLASNTNFIDLNRVAVYGFSYGGYLSLLCLAQRPDIFRLAIAGAPVTNWQLYDTGYTERYMDTPEANSEGYAKGSVLNHVNNFPNEPRIMILHGLNDENVHFTHSVDLIHELIKANKPHDLKIFPYERHSIRKSQSHIYFTVTLLSFLKQNL